MRKRNLFQKSHNNLVSLIAVLFFTQAVFAAPIYDIPDPNLYWQQSRLSPSYDVGPHYVPPVGNTPAIPVPNHPNSVAQGSFATGYWAYYEDVDSPNYSVMWESEMNNQSTQSEQFWGLYLASDGSYVVGQITLAPNESLRANLLINDFDIMTSVETRGLNVSGGRSSVSFPFLHDDILTEDYLLTGAPEPGIYFYSSDLGSNSIATWYGRGTGNPLPDGWPALLQWQFNPLLGAIPLPGNLPAGIGGNVVVFGNPVIVPEPTSLALLGPIGLCFVLCRKHQS